MRATMPISVKGGAKPAGDAVPRILFVNHAAVTGGAELVLLDVARAFSGSAEVVLFDDGPFRRALMAEGVRARVMAMNAAVQRVRREDGVPSVGAALGAAALAVRLARRARRFDVMYANSQKAFVVASVAALLARRPLVWHLHDILSDEHFSRANIRIDVALANLVAARVLAVSQAAADAFVRHGGDPAKVFVVHNGIDVAPFAARPAADMAAARAELGVSGRVAVGCFSRLAPWKGQHVLVEALRWLPAVHAVFVGEALFGHADYRESLLERARSLGVADRVHFTGPRTDVPRLMQAVDAVVHSPVAPEPFGRVVAEAMLAGTPVVAARAGGPLEMIREGIDGLFFEADRADDLAHVLGGLLSDPAGARSLAAAAQRSARLRFSRRTMLRSLTGHLHDVVAPPR